MYLIKSAVLSFLSYSLKPYRSNRVRTSFCGPILAIVFSMKSKACCFLAAASYAVGMAVVRGLLNLFATMLKGFPLVSCKLPLERLTKS